MRKSLLALTLLSASLSTATFAQQPQQQGRGTAEEQKACTRDVQKFCRPVIDQGDFTVLACLKENRAKISQACDQVLKTHNQ
jgi:Cysteine rich repeat